MADEASSPDQANPSHMRVVPLHTNRIKRRYVPPVIRYMVVAFFGGMLGLLASYALRKIGM